MSQGKGYCGHQQRRCQGLGGLPFGPQMEAENEVLGDNRYPLSWWEEAVFLSRNGRLTPFLEEGPPPKLR